ncbi:MAG TPA: S41 family peptidase [Vicinamibacterales bacterium]|nr:S41 family peptidase [Vicinamibacterales bacterium]
MELVALVLAAFFQLVSLSLDQLRETVDAIKTALVTQYVDAAEGQRLAGVLDRELAEGFSCAYEPGAFAAAVQGLNEAQGNATIAAQLDGAMRAVAGASALVFDVRLNPGGDLSSAAHLSTYLFSTRTHLLSRALRGRSDVIDVWTRDEVPGPRVPNVPVYVLTSADRWTACAPIAKGPPPKRSTSR